MNDSGRRSDRGQDAPVRFSFGAYTSLTVPITSPGFGRVSMNNPSLDRRPAFVRSLATTLEMIKFSHTLFALPFALLAAVLAARGLPSWTTIVKILLAMAGARSAAMAHNR